MITFAAFALLAASLLALARLFLGPTLYDRVLAVNSFGTKTVLFLCVFAAFIDRPDAIDIAILYALINFIATIAVLKFFRYRNLERALSREAVSAADPMAAAPAQAAPVEAESGEAR